MAVVGVDLELVVPAIKSRSWPAAYTPLACRHVQEGAGLFEKWRVSQPAPHISARAKLRGYYTRNTSRVAS
jgi:hypothetical protein